MPERFHRCRRYYTDREKAELFAKCLEEAYRKYPPVFVPDVEKSDIRRPITQGREYTVGYYRKMDNRRNTV